MSTTAPAPETLSLPASAGPDVQTFRGRTLEELLPQIRDQLGPDAVVLRQRDGLMGGIGGFFQQRFVEVDARAGAPAHRRIDVYDDEVDVAPEPFAPPAPPAIELPAAAPAAAPALPAAERPAAEPFAALLAEAESAAHEPSLLDARPAAKPAPPAAEPAAPQPEPAPLLTHELTQAGMSHAFAERLVADAEAHELPFAHGDRRLAVRRALARRIPTSLPHRAGGLAVAFAGPGSTACADALATAYKQAGRDARTIASLDKARTLIERGDAGVIAVDLPPVALERAEVDALAARAATLQLDELVAVLPAALDLPSARGLLDRLHPLAPTALVLALDATSDAQLGAALELVCATRLPLAYVHDGATIAPADPTSLVERLLP